MRRKLVLLATGFFYATAAWAGEASSPYTGQERREIKALSREELGGYLSGDGMGFAKTAELNHYPGPRHVLELAGQLQLSGEQRKKTQAIFDEMKSKAMSLGKQLVEKEQLLDSRFAEGTITDAELEQLVTEISVIQGKLRAVHLRAHLAQRVVLTQDQIRIYDAHRGYQQPEADDPQHLARGVQAAAVRGTAPPQAHGARRTAGPEERAGILQLLAGIDLPRRPNRR